MIKAVSVKQIQKLDDAAINQYGIPSLVLMENAGRAVFESIQRLSRNKRVVVVCGVGNNAGDGFVVARHLINAGIKTKIVLIGRKSKLKNDALVNYNILRKLRIEIVQGLRMTPAIRQSLTQADIVIDAIFGVGLNREVSSPFKEYIECINTSAKKVICVDVPSGLDASSGRIYGCCVKAHRTISFTYAKTGFYIGGGKKMCGRVSVVDIGIPEIIKSKVIQ